MNHDDYDKTDMGPFAGMNPNLVDAISNYGTPPYRMTISVSVRDVGHSSFDDLPEDIDGWVAWLVAARLDTPEEHRANLHCVLDFDYGYADSGSSADLSVWYERPETDAEMTNRVNRGVAYVNGKAEAERRQYEALKRKFG